MNDYSRQEKQFISRVISSQPQSVGQTSLRTILQQFQNCKGLSIESESGIELSQSESEEKAIQRKVTLQAGVVQQKSSINSGNVIQMVNYHIIGNSIIDKKSIERLKGDKDNVIIFDKDFTSKFDESYNGSIKRIMDWLKISQEACAGFELRNFSPLEFCSLAQKASENIARLKKTKELNYESNKTFVSVRVFRAAVNSDIGKQSVEDLEEILRIANQKSEDLQKKQLISSGSAPPKNLVLSIEADPAEAHPSTLPTVKITFQDGSITYFKGRDAAVEKVLFGTELGTVASTMSAIGPGIAGRHSFLSLPGGILHKMLRKAN